MVFPDCHLAGHFTPGPAAGLCKAALSISVQVEEAQVAYAQAGLAGRRQQVEKQLAPCFQGEESWRFRTGDVPRQGEGPLCYKAKPLEGESGSQHKVPIAQPQGARREELRLPGAC